MRWDSPFRMFLLQNALQPARAGLWDDINKRHRELGLAPILQDRTCAACLYPWDRWHRRAHGDQQPTVCAICGETMFACQEQEWPGLNNARHKACAEPELAERVGLSVPDVASQ